MPDIASAAVGSILTMCFSYTQTDSDTDTERDRVRGERVSDREREVEIFRTNGSLFLLPKRFV